jgi:uncharacterized protein Yka (UPF0111/DUF47 family)
MVRLPFIPKEHKFFELFEESAQNTVKAAQVLKELVDSWQFVDSRVAEITEMEHRGDTITHQILSLVNRTFVTPFDREDIALLAHTMDDVLDVERAVSGLRRRSELKRILESCVEINRLENMADRVYRAGMAELFDNATDIPQLIKWREIYEHMESATDRCEDVANVLEGVALKHA